MPQVTLTATKAFSYATRRLKAGDSFTVDAPMARVLVAIGKAEAPREPGRVPAPPARVAEKIEAAATPAPPPPAPAPPPPPPPASVPAMTSKTAEVPRTRRRRRAAAKKG